MDLLSLGDIAEIRNALHDVTDTFCKTVCTLIIYQDNADPLGRVVGESYTDYTVNALVEYRDEDGDHVFRTEDGAAIRADIKVTLNVDDMGTMGLLDVHDQPIVNMTTDKITINGKKKIIVLVTVEGAFQNKNILCIIYCNNEPTES